MIPERFEAITAAYPRLTVGILGDFCLDRYLEIDPTLAEKSIETGLPVRNVVRVRAQPGGAGTILNNVAALGAGRIVPVGVCGDDGEGYELRRALGSLRGVSLDHFEASGERRTFTYCKPLIVEAGKVPVELERLDSKNWTATPEAVERWLIRSIEALGEEVDALVVLEQVDRAGTGVATCAVLERLRRLAAARPVLPILADSRRGLGDWPPLSWKMNAAELGALLGRGGELELAEVLDAARVLADRNVRPVFVSLSERGLVGAEPGRAAEHVSALPVRGPIDIVGAGDAVTANLALAMAAGATLRESMELAMVAASVVIHQVGTTGTASVEELRNWAGMT